MVRIYEITTHWIRCVCWGVFKKTQHQYMKYRKVERYRSRESLSMMENTAVAVRNMLSVNGLRILWLDMTEHLLLISYQKALTVERIPCAIYHSIDFSKKSKTHSFRVLGFSMGNGYFLGVFIKGPRTKCFLFSMSLSKSGASMSEPNNMQDFDITASDNHVKCKNPHTAFRPV